VHDTIGFTKYNWQLDSIYFADSKIKMQWKAAISPHDDYKYAGRLYYESLKGINANDYFSGCCTSCSKLYASRQNHFGDFTH
jgi:hypothetical protein